MNFPNGGAEIVQRLYEKNKQLAEGTDDDRRKLTKMIGETFSYQYGPRWGTKSQTRNHPPSKDSIAYLLDNKNLDIWDWQNGATKAPVVRDGGAPNFTNVAHFFIECEPINHLAEPVPGPAPGQEPGPAPNPSEVIQLLREIRDGIVLMNEQLRTVVTYILNNS